MMLLNFSLLLLAVLTTWTGYRKYALALFSVTMILTLITFLHHMTSNLAIQL
jgi:hypothetical protein